VFELYLIIKQTIIKNINFFEYDERSNVTKKSTTIIKKEWMEYKNNKLLRIRAMHVQTYNHLHKTYQVPNLPTDLYPLFFSQ
jgi:hypothetical protein